MAFTTTIDTASELQTAFQACNRDTYSWDAYQVLIDLSEACDGIELDVIALDCEWAEGAVEDIIKDYAHMMDIPSDASDDELFELVLELINDNTYGVATQNNTHFMYQQF